MKAINYFILITLVMILSACSEDFLDLKNNQRLVVPSKIEDYQAMLDYPTIMNTKGGFILGEMSTDDYYLTETRFDQLSKPTDKNAYIWATDIFMGDQSYDWNRAYARVLTANLVLEGLNKVDDPENIQWKQAKGDALFRRAHSFYLLTLQFGDVYKRETASEDLGIPLRTESDISKKIKRASMDETYKQMIDDLIEASTLLPSMPLVKTRGSKAAAHALMAKCYLNMDDYENAGKQADSVLNISDYLMDYNDIDLNKSYPFEEYNGEVLFADGTAMPVPLSRNYMNVDSSLYNSYNSNDLRKSAFFYMNGINRAYKGSYTGNSSHFIGIKMPEIYLIRAEVSVRAGDIQKALTDLNHLLKYRSQKGTYSELEILDQQELLDKILIEKRKELVFSGIRWGELKRLNKDSKTQRILYRKLGESTYELQPGSKLYNMPIPKDAVELGGLRQNER